VSANKAFEKLSVKRPPGSLAGFINISSIILQVLLVCGFQSFSLYYVQQQPWYVPTNQSNYDIKNNSKTMDSTAVFLVSTFQYVSMAFVYSKGPPFRKSIINNWKFLLSLIVLTATNAWLTVIPVKPVLDWMDVRI